MNKIAKFFNEKFGNLRGRHLNGEAWTYATDVCKCLDIKNAPDAVAKLDDDEKLTIDNTDSQKKRGGARKFILVNEAGLFRLIFASRKPDARDFQRWVFHDVLPALRREAVWNEIRLEGKETRRELTDTIKKFIGYLKETDRLDRPEVAWYTAFSKVINKVVGTNDKRDNLSYLQLLRIQDCEDKLVPILEKGMEERKTHHEIWLECKAKLNVE